MLFPLQLATMEPDQTGKQGNAETEPLVATLLTVGLTTFTKLFIFRTLCNSCSRPH